MTVTAYRLRVSGRDIEHYDGDSVLSVVLWKAALSESGKNGGIMSSALSAAAQNCSKFANVGDWGAEGLDKYWWACYYSRIGMERGDNSMKSIDWTLEDPLADLTEAELAEVIQEVIDNYEAEFGAKQEAAETEKVAE